MVPTSAQPIALPTHLRFAFIDIGSTTVVRALMQVQLETGVPVISAVLTPHHFHEHAEHRKYFLKNFAVKGTEAAMACLQTVAGLRSLGVGG